MRPPRPIHQKELNLHELVDEDRPRLQCIEGPKPAQYRSMHTSFALTVNPTMSDREKRCWTWGVHHIHGMRSKIADHTKMNRLL